MNYNWDTDKKVSQFLKNLDIYTYLNNFNLINKNYERKRNKKTIIFI
jgi:hypothetical protein